MKTRRFQSHATSPGIAIGRAHRLAHHGIAFVKTWVRDQDVEAEISRFKEAVIKSKEQIARIQTKMCRYEGNEQIKILESQRLFLQDDMLVNTTVSFVRELRINAEWALDKTLGSLRLAFMNVQEDYFRERRQDIDYAGRRLLNNLIGHSEISLKELPEGELIIVTHDLSPAEVASLPRERVKGFIMEAGGMTSHSAIISRALEIPAMFGVKEIADQIQEGETLILDGIKGILIASPSPRELDQYRQVQDKYNALEQILLQDIHLPTVTKDGFRIRLDANMEIIEEIPSIVQHGAEGIGLYRTEYLFINRMDEPSEEEQFENYVTILKKLSPKAVTIRTIDIGGDKLAFSQRYEAQVNPALGLRAIRLCLRELPMFRTQLRALLRASVHGNLRILLPMISGVEEVLEVKKIIRQIKRELAQKKMPYQEKVPLGIMVEVPAAVITASLLAKEVDFFSIGTNDLIQYGLAIDRVNELVSDLYNPFHPAVLRMIRQTVEAAKRAGIPVSVCGEMAGDPLAIALFVGMELDSLSMNPISIPRVKKILRSLTMERSKRLLAEVMEMATTEEVEKHLKKDVGHLLPMSNKHLSIIKT